MPIAALSSKALLSFIPLLILSYSFNAQALSAITAKTIKGTAPYIEQNGIKATDLNSLLSINIGTKTYISDAAGTMQEVGAGGVLTPVTTLPSLVNAGDTFSSVSTLIPADGTSYALNNAAIIPLANRKDDDDDSAFWVTGNIKGVWTDKNNKQIGSLTDTPSICNASYTLTLTTTGTPSISTQYGDPRITTYGNSSAVFKINPAAGPMVCFAKPNMRINNGGPANLWNGSKGFITQSTSPANYGNNFPTTGANGLYFDLDISGSATPLTWTSMTVNGITAAPDTTIPITATSVRYKLTGPTAAVPGGTFSSTGATFELEGKDVSGATVVKYGFTLKKWYINRGGVQDNAPGHASWCAARGYRQSRTSDIAGQYFGYKRSINGYLLWEWGDVTGYAGAGFLGGGLSYWLADSPSGQPNTIKYTTYLNSGIVGSGSASVSGPYGVCTTP